MKKKATKKTVKVTDVEAAMFADIAARKTGLDMIISATNKTAADIYRDERHAWETLTEKYELLTDVERFTFNSKTNEIEPVT